MGISLEKGGRINLSKNTPGLTRVRLGLGWNANRYDTGHDFDLDASAFVCKLNAAGEPKLISDQHFVFYGNEADPQKATVHSGDCRTGEGDGDDESIVVDLTKLSADAAEISFIVTIHDCVARGQNFGQVSNSYIKIYDDVTGAELANYDLEEEFSTETAVQFGSLYKKDNQWSFKAVGAGYKLGLADFVVGYGGNLK